MSIEALENKTIFTTSQLAEMALRPLTLEEIPLMRHVVGLIVGDLARAEALLSVRGSTDLHCSAAAQAR